MNLIKLSPIEINFRKVAILEGISYLSLLGIAMPFKYFANMPIVVDIMGWIHGLLFIIYMCFLAIMYFKLNWKFKRAFLAGIASLLPFGPFIFDKRIFYPSNYAFDKE